MRRYKYHGSEPVDVDALGLVGVTQNTIVEVEDPDVADGFDGQDAWEHIPDPQRSRAAKKAAATRASDDDPKES